MAKKNPNHDVFTAIAQVSDESLRGRFLADIAGSRHVPVETLTSEFEGWQKTNADALEKEQAKIEKAARAARLETLSKEAQGISLDSETISDFLARVVAEGGQTVVNPDLTLSVTLPAVRKGGTGGGRVKATHIQPFVDSDGDRVIGPITFWVKENLTELEAKEANCYRPNGKIRSGETLTKALVKAGIFTPEPLTADETAANSTKD